MKFCDVCRNMLYVNVRDNKLVLACACCSSEYDHPDQDAPLSDTLYRDDSAKYHHLVTPLIHSDPTLPRIKHIKCKNESCTKPDDKDNNVVYVKYDDDNLRFLYSCSYCNAFWGPEDIGVVFPEDET